MEKFSRSEVIEDDSLETDAGQKRFAVNDDSDPLTSLGTVTYDGIPVKFYLNGRPYRSASQHLSPDAVSKMLVYRNHVMDNTNVMQRSSTGTGITSELLIDSLDIDDYATFNVTDNDRLVVCQLEMVKGWRPGKNYSASRGVRYTTLHGYSRPQTFMPASRPDASAAYSYSRRTLYWNPDVVTDSQGEAVVNFYNSARSAQLFIEAETISDGIIGQTCGYENR